MHATVGLQSYGGHQGHPSCNARRVASGSRASSTLNSARGGGVNGQNQLSGRKRPAAVETTVESSQGALLRSETSGAHKCGLLFQGLLGLVGSGVGAKTVLGALAGASLAVGRARRCLFRRFSRPVDRKKRRRVVMSDEGDVVTLSVVTFNLRGISDRWPERMPLLRSCLSELNADVYAFQEVLTGEFAQEREILGDDYEVHGCKAALGHLLQLGGVAGLYGRWLRYALRFSCLRNVMVKMPLWVEAWREGWRVRGVPAVLLRDITMAPFFGNSLVSSLPSTQPTDVDQLWLGEFRAAQRICITGPLVFPQRDGECIGGLWVVNTHLHHDEGKPSVRADQVDAICRWMETVMDGAVGAIIAGDLNAHPREEMHAVFTSFGYQSAYDVAGVGEEPPVTWPSGLVAPLMDEGPPMCLDYMYIKSGPRYAVEVASLQLAGDTPCQGDATLYPSDHFGLHAVLRVKPRPTEMPSTLAT